MSAVRYVRCVLTDAPIEYRGYGRPPKYSEAVRREADRIRRRAKRAEKAAARKAPAFR